MGAVITGEVLMEEVHYPIKYATLEHVSMEARPYPAHLLEGCDTGLVLFSAAFQGTNDAVWFAQTDMMVTCVDHDHAKLTEMQSLYPIGWEFVTADVFEFIQTTKRKWDVVSADPFTNLFASVADRVERLCELANETVVVGTGFDTDVMAPEGWEVSEVVRRSDYKAGVFWTVLTRA